MIERTSRLTLSDFLPFHGKHKRTGQRAGPINSCFCVGAVDNSFANMSPGYPFLVKTERKNSSSPLSLQGEQIRLARSTRFFTKLTL